MKLIKLNKLSAWGDITVKEIYLNADKIISVRQESNYSEIDISHQDTCLTWKVQETVEEIQSLLRGAENDK